MWSNLNESFTAITGHISNITQTVNNSIPAFGDNERALEVIKLRKLETKLSLLIEEVERQRQISLVYKDRWLNAESHVKQITGQLSQVYDDDVDLLTADIETNEALGDDHLHNGLTLSELAFDSSTERIHQLEDELNKVVADQQHWRALATQKSENAEELAKSRTRIEELESKVNELQELYDQKGSEFKELNEELLELDQQHEQALNKVLKIKDQLQEENNAIAEELSQLKTQLDEEKACHQTEVQSKKEYEEDAGDVTKEKREEPEGATLPDAEDVKKDLSAVLSTHDLQLRSSEEELQKELCEKRVLVQQLDERLKCTLDDRDRLLHRMKECESLQIENQLLKSSANSSQLSLDQLRRDYDQLLVQNRYLEEEMKNKKPNEDSLFKKMSQLVREKEDEIVGLKARLEALEITVEEEKHKLTEDEKLEEISRLKNELSRLRQHLIGVEEGYTQEVVVAEERENALRNRLVSAEEELKAVQNRIQADKYEEQIRSLCTEREIARNEVSQLEDKLQQYSASVANLQLVIEQIQKENERKLQLSQRQHTHELQIEKGRTEETLKKLKSQEDRFADTLEALGAASRLSESIDMKEQTIANMKIDASKKDNVIYALRQEIDQLKASSEGKVDKQIMKSLIIGYFVTPNDKRHEVERLLARFLDFNQQEMEKTKIVIGRKRTPSGNWIPFFGGSNSDSLSLKFVQFLENESKPNESDKELTRDLSKSLITASFQPIRNNPFLASTSLGSRNSSANSSTDNLNQLLSVPQMTPFAPLIVSTPIVDNSDQSMSRKNSSNDILRNVLQK